MKSPFFCLKCEKRNKCIKICDKLEKILPRPSSGRMRRGEHSFDPFILDNITMRRKKQGYRHKPRIYNDNWEESSDW
jgi:hypothetical protein